MAFENIDQLVSGTINSSQFLTFNKIGIIPRSTFNDLFYSAGLPGSASLPASTSVGGTSYDSGSIGGLSFSRSIDSNEHIASLSFSSTREGTFYLIDHLWGCGGLAITTGSTSTIVGMTNITRYNNGEGCEIAFVNLNNTASPGGGAGTKTMRVSYTNSEGVSGRTGSIIFPTITNTSPSYPFMVFSTLDDGDKGVQSVQSVTNTNISFSAGNIGLVILKRLIMMPIGLGSSGLQYDALKTGLINIDKNACLSFVSATSNGVSTGMFNGTINIITV
jgi:hypothetical protein